jgi:hypothetical protein
MKTLLLFLVISSGLYGQVAITGPLYDASGALATCQVTMRPVSVPGFAPATISYVIVTGDLTGSTGGYGQGVTGISRHAALQGYAGTYSSQVICSGAVTGSKTYTWTLAGSTVTIQSLLGLTPITPTLGTLTGTLGTLSGTLGTLGQ